MASAACRCFIEMMCRLCLDVSTGLCGLHYVSHEGGCFVAARNLKNHALSASLSRLQHLLNNKYLQDPKVASDEAASFNREKLVNVARTLRTLLNQSSASTVSEAGLSQINANLQQPIAELTAFVSNLNVGHLANAVSYIDQNVLSYTWAFFPKLTPSTKAEVTEAFLFHSVTIAGDFRDTG